MGVTTKLHCNQCGKDFTREYGVGIDGHATLYCAKKSPPELLAARKANRELERLLLGDGFHARTRIKKSKKLYCRKKKHSEQPVF